MKSIKIFEVFINSFGIYQQSEVNCDLLLLLSFDFFPINLKNSLSLKEIKNALDFYYSFEGRSTIQNQYQIYQLQRENSIRLVRRNFYFVNTPSRVDAFSHESFDINPENSINSSRNPLVIFQFRFDFNPLHNPHWNETNFIFNSEEILKTLFSVSYNYSPAQVASSNRR